MKHKINYRNAEEYLHATYEDMDGMTLDDAIIILSEPVRKYHKAKNDREHINLSRPRMIKAFEIVIEAAKTVNMRGKVREYIAELDEEIERCELILRNTSDLIAESRLETLVEVKNDLKNRLEESV